MRVLRFVCSGLLVLALVGCAAPREASPPASAQASVQPGSAPGGVVVAGPGLRIGGAPRRTNGILPSESPQRRRSERDGGVTTITTGPDGQLVWGATVDLDDLVR